MRSLLLYACLGGALGAQGPLHIVAVERKGLPPYEGADRIYRLDGGLDRGLRVGHWLTVRRPGESRPLGHLRISEVRGAEAEARFEPTEAGYPMKGDLVWREVLGGMPALAIPDMDPMPAPALPARAPVPPPREGLLFFLPQRMDLSPAGQQKLKAWVQAWGSAGRWAIQVPSSRSLRPGLQGQRAETLLAALRALGVEGVAVERDPRAADGKYDPAWIRHWD